jgi:hypothetical protein
LEKATKIKDVFFFFDGDGDGDGDGENDPQTISPRRKSHNDVVVLDYVSG